MSAGRRLYGRAVAAASACGSRLAVAAAQRPRSAAAAVFGMVLVAFAAAPAAPAAAAPAPAGCGGGLTGLLCSGAHGIAGVAKQIPGVKGLVNSAEGAYHTVDSLTPSNFLDSWAQGLCHAVIFVLTFIQSTADKLGTPAFNQQWWATQYAVSFGLALVVLAFMLVMVTTRIGGSDGSVSGVELLRQSGWRFIFVVPACALAPAFMYALQQLAAALTKSFATRASVQADGAVGAFLHLLEKKAGNNWGDFGGTVMVIALMIPILCCGIVLLVEVSVSNWGMMMCGLLVPLALVAAVYPPWARILRRLVGIILGLMFLPCMIFFLFWTVWSAFNSNITGQGGSNSSVTMLIFLLVSLVMIDAFPIVAVWLLGVVAPGTEQMDPDVKGLSPSPSAGEVFSDTFEKPFRGGKPESTERDTDASGGGETAGDDDDGDRSGGAGAGSPVDGGKDTDASDDAADGTGDEGSGTEPLTGGGGRDDDSTGGLDGDAGGGSMDDGGAGASAGVSGGGADAAGGGA